jgi:flagellar hook assembly protein FlgD
LCSGPAGNEPRGATGLELHVFDVAGRVVRKLDAGQLATGTHEVEWDGTDESHRWLSAGAYLYALMVNGTKVGARKTVLLD